MLHVTAFIYSLHKFYETIVVNDVPFCIGPYFLLKMHKIYADYKYKYLSV